MLRRWLIQPLTSGRRGVAAGDVPLVGQAERDRVHGRSLEQRFERHALRRPSRERSSWTHCRSRSGDIPDPSSSRAPPPCRSRRRCTSRRCGCGRLRPRAAAAVLALKENDELAYPPLTYGIQWPMAERRADRRWTGCRRSVAVQRQRGSWGSRWSPRLFGDHAEPDCPRRRGRRRRSGAGRRASRPQANSVSWSTLNLPGPPRRRGLPSVPSIDEAPSPSWCRCRSRSSWRAPPYGFRLGRHAVGMYDGRGCCKRTGYDATGKEVFASCKYAHAAHGCVPPKDPWPAHTRDYLCGRSRFR